MHRVFIEIFGHPIYWYGVLTAIGFLAAVANWSYLSMRDGREKGLGSEIGIWVMAGGILGARAAYIMANWSDFAQIPLEMIRIDKGGLIYYGGFIGGSLAIILLARMRKEPLLNFADFVVTSVPLGHALGRIGCFLNGCCYGTYCELPWAVYHEQANRHPTPLYETGFNLVVYVILLWFYSHKKRENGMVLGLYLLLYPAGRFIFEFTRGDGRMRWMGLTVAQEISVGLFIAGCILWIALLGKRIKSDG